jgi:hypothetical protein
LFHFWISDQNDRIPRAKKSPASSQFCIFHKAEEGGNFSPYRSSIPFVFSRSKATRKFTQGFLIPHASKAVCLLPSA